ncbi:MAG: 30S ribosomal protein S9 [Flavobacteriales bacterium CG18_big_fil_WC_8_21_14_2_50_32_9]|jgi:small subunit ribosomal protein S9|nr:30S ribosomal protein S9 [Flavobacteriales bacterium]PIQ17150.1 MAG: 30S ribosomal protein S9 [Flavobacteriales bacterium CG18_big_fil_WC_8_21_14_2_50_32_9]PJC62492.1 MAG: 30S ribosomal protein S9 [Flavobacteriales bacterium CG_4_9_14_0_2_um_filter_32_27]
MEVINATGRRKTAVARVYLTKGKGNVTVNKKDYKVFFPTTVLQGKIQQAFVATDTKDTFDVKVNVFGGGITGQAEAVRHAISRALVKSDETNRALLKVDSLLTRDPRMVERKKPGQPKARKQFQFSKR